LDDIPLSILFGVLLLLIILSGFFSSSETSMMALNRYRLKHLVKDRHRGAIMASNLLKRPDRLIGLILIGNNFVNIAASALATIIAIRLWGDAGVAIATGLLTLVILIFSEVTPKTLAALHPERIAFPAAFILRPLLLVFYPLVWLVNFIANKLLSLFGVRMDEETADHVTQDELRTIVHEAGALIPQRHQNMLLSILDLEKVTVEDIMIPRNEVTGIDLENDLDDIIQQIRTSQHTRLPVFTGDINNICGILHLRNAARFLTEEDLTKAAIVQTTREPYFIPESTPLNTQLLNFQREKRRIGLVVDEYGDIQGIATLEDILEEIVGEFTTDAAASSKDIHPQEDGSYIIDGSANIRDINKVLNWKLPTKGPKTLNGLIMESLESIPDASVGFKIGNFYIETLQTKDNIIKTARITETSNKD
jgi:Mg2+/Co2+ transporter CorB